MVIARQARELEALGLHIRDGRAAILVLRSDPCGAVGNRFCQLFVHLLMGAWCMEQLAATSRCSPSRATVRQANSVEQVMSMLILSDLHVSANLRDSYRDAFLRKVPKIAKDLEIDQIVIAGDLTEEKDHHGAELVNRVVNHIVAMREVAFVIGLLGNHDYVAREHPFFAFLGHLDRVDFITSPKAKLLGRTGNVMFLPHTRDYKNDWKGMTFGNKDVVFAHNTFIGADLGNGRKATDGIPVDVFAKTQAWIFSGDVHTPQKVGPVTYIGAPYTVDFGDDYEPRMIHYRNGSYKSIPCDGPQKRLVEMNAKTDIGSIRLREGDILKVRVTLMQENRPRWQELLDKIHAWAKKRGYIINSVQPIFTDGKDVAVERSARTPKNDGAVVREFAKQRDVDPKTLKTGLFLMEKK